MEDKNLTPKQIVGELDKYIIGQDNAKKAVAIALRNRYRRGKLQGEIKDEIIPKNILMIGPTGVGKTEIARRLAKLVNAPFIKVEATKFTEVGYVGRDVESMVRELVEVSVQSVKQKNMEEVKEKADVAVIFRLVDILQPRPKIKPPSLKNGEQNNNSIDYQNHYLAFPEEPTSQIDRIRERIRKQLINNEIEDRVIEIDIEEGKFPIIEVFAGAGIEGMGMHIQEMLGNVMPKKKKKRKTTIGEAKRILLQEEMQKLIDMESVVKEGITKAEEKGIIFIDELDKIAGRERGGGPDVSREGVQRDLLPIIEGSTVFTKYGPVKTDFVLFISAGAFHISKPSDLIPELQGRFPIRVELDSLNKDDFKRILLEPKNALIKQYISLLEVENIKVKFSEDAINEIAELAQRVNEQTENIGARRLHTILEKVVEDISFDVEGNANKNISISAKYVKGKLEEVVKSKDLSRYIL